VDNLIQRLMQRFDGGTLTRRELMQGLTLLAAAGTTASAQSSPGAIQGVSINHVSLNVRDIQRSGEWYSKMFNLPKMQTKEENNYMLGLGLTPADREHGALGHLSIHPTPAGKTPGVIDHFCLGLSNFNEAKVIEELKKRGANPQGLHVKDPDGLTIQLNSIDGHA
jgi:catechol 2,3-dioxygenase-like lactoylglutathione lyase family enzyme